MKKNQPYFYFLDALADTIFYHDYIGFLKNFKLDMTNMDILLILNIW